MPPQSRHDRAEDYENSPLRHSTVGADRMLRFGPAPTEEIPNGKSFIREFIRSEGPPQIVILVMLLALGFGSTIGVVRIYGARNPFKCSVQFFHSPCCSLI